MRKRLSYANVAATLALVFSMSGGALAANHYLISSTKQINPEVLKKLKGNAGAKGATGSPGLQGPKGETGKEGPQGTYPTSLPSGQTEAGVWGGGLTAAAIHASYRETGSFPVPVTGGLPEGHAIYIAGASGKHCPGAGHADPGFLCLYQGFIENAETPESHNVFNPENVGGEPDEGAGEHGFSIFLKSEATGITAVTGTFAVTAP